MTILLHFNVPGRDPNGIPITTEELEAEEAARIAALEEEEPEIPVIPE